MADDLKSLHERLLRLEERSEKRIIKAKEIHLFDDQSGCRAILAAAENGLVLLSLNDSAGNERLLLAVNADGDPGIAFMDAHGRPRLGIVQRRDDNIQIVLLDDKQQVIWSAPPGITNKEVKDFWGNLPTKGIH